MIIKPIKYLKTFLVLTIESSYVAPYLVKIIREEIHNDIVEFPRWDCSNFQDDISGLRLVEEIIRRTQVLLKNLDYAPDAICMTVPGTIKDFTTILKSNRLCIKEPINVADLFRQKAKLRCIVLHDTECLGLGEAKHGAFKFESNQHALNSFAYVLVDEGVGSTIFIDGKPLKGAGSAGHIGRLVVDPRGQYNPTFLSRGSLEVFASRPWVSKNIVGGYLSEKGKIFSSDENEVRSIIDTVAEVEKNWNSLNYWVIAKGLSERDPIVISVIEDAAMYLGLAINCLLSIAHPPAIMLGGNMVTELPGFYDTILSYARRFSWELAWNRTSIKMAELGRRAQILGAAEILKEIDAKRNDNY